MTGRWRPEPVTASRVPFDIAAGVPVCGFTGPNGVGKSTLAVASAIADMAAGRTVYSTLPIRSAFGESKPIVSLRQLVELENCTLLLDEVAMIFSSRDSSRLPGDVVLFLQTARHRGLSIRWTAPAWMRADNLLRSATQGCVGVWPVFKRKQPGDPWPRPSLVMAGLLDTSQGKTDSEPTRVLRRRFIRPAHLGVWGTFDSWADTPLLGASLSQRHCLDCGGSIRTPEHSKARHDQLQLPWFDGDLYERRASVVAASDAATVPVKRDTPA